MIQYRFGIRFEKTPGSVHFGIGITWFTERALVISMFGREIFIGRIYGMVH